MKFDFARLKVPVCFLVMVLAALAVVVIMGNSEIADVSGDRSDIVQQSALGEEDMEFQMEEDV